MITNADKIKEAVRIEDFMAHEGFAPDSRGKCACPVHGGKDKNFSVKNGIGTCWSQCGGKSWDAVGLAIELRKITYPEALELLAGIGKIEVEYADGKNRIAVIEQAKLEKTEKDKLREVMTRAVTAYRDQQGLVPGLYDRVYVDKERTYSATTLVEFGVCYSGPNMVLQKQMSQDIEYLLKLGLVKKSDTYMYEPFRNRILYPIADENGRPVGISARKMHDDVSEYPKWVNSQESLIYNKSHILYGLHKTKTEIKKAGFAYLVEGNGDLLTMWDNGIKNTVATCGTALTEHQAKLLKKYTEKVIMLYDGDEAGVAAARRSTEKLSAAGIFIEVVLLKDGEDPDSFVRKHGAKALHFFVEHNTQDAITWRVMEGFKKDDMFSKNTCESLAVQIISKIPVKSVADSYIISLSKKLGATRAHLTDQIKEAQGKATDRKYDNKTEEQQRDIAEYGLFVENNRYYMCDNPESMGQEVSNFVIKPLMLIIGSDRSWRLVEVKNDKGKTFTADIDSDAFVDIASLKKELERRGNFIYKGRPEWFTRIKSKIYNETAECYPVNTLGWHSAGFWVFGNGIVSNNEFKGIDEYGIVEHGDYKYFLPAFAKVKAGSEDDDNTFEDEKEFIYVSGRVPSFQEWTRRFIEVHGPAGMMGISYYIAALFRDIIYKKFQYFPHLNLFGPPGAGKSFMAWSIQAMFGKSKAPFHLVQGTQVGFFRRLAKVRNGISWFDEYSNDVEFKRIEALKAAYDGVGHEKGDRDNENNIKRTKVKSSCIISGQQQPTQDVALFKRCISLNFPRFERDDKRDALGRELKDIEQTNRLGQITAMLMKFRPTIETEFSTQFDKVRAIVSPLVAHDNRVEDRILNNHLIPLTIFKLLESQLEFSFSFEALKNWTVNNIIEQSGAISNQDELSTWWRIFNYLVEMDLLKHDVDFIVAEEDKVTITTGRNSSQQKVFAEKKTILFVRFEKSYPMYQEYHKRQLTKNGLPETSLKHYLRGFDSFIGEVKAKKFNSQSKYCWAFEMEAVNLNIPLTKLFKAQEDVELVAKTSAQENAEMVAAIKDVPKAELPF
jgi:DNA primase